MLAPLHWQDYKKKYGKLDDFVVGHPELFLIEGNYIQLRDGAQGIIAATAAVAKVVAAAAASFFTALTNAESAFKWRWLEHFWRPFQCKNFEQVSRFSSIQQY
ncbi:hypothetical protein Nepgr_006100 [Nepenthes gracilis]|uniref:DUF7725 domain-containing protein n=1 Tax=Nepenthes gracilis TaxID=150966 RepID=A0AAD3XH95_NEPGR|nr:hypothetical protein Nepgr_006100 [Nepenthes gracilis]